MKHDARARDARTMKKATRHGWQMDPRCERLRIAPGLDTLVQVRTPQAVGAARLLVGPRCLKGRTCTLPLECSPLTQPCSQVPVFTGVLAVASSSVLNSHTIWYSTRSTRHSSFWKVEKWVPSPPTVENWENWVSLSPQYKNSFKIDQQYRTNTFMETLNLGTP